MHESPDEYDPFTPDPDAQIAADIAEFTATHPAPPDPPAPIDDAFSDDPPTDPVEHRRSRIAGLSTAIEHAKDEIRHTGNPDRVAELQQELARYERELAAIRAAPPPTAFVDDPFQDAPAAPDPAAGRRPASRRPRP